MATKLLSELARGTWNSSDSYSVGDIVDYNSSSYICIANNTNQVPPNVTYWAVLAKGLIPKGAYDNSTDYNVGEVVSYLGSSYIMYVNASAGVLPTDTTKWQVIAIKGDTGNTGNTGSTGPQGDEVQLQVSGGYIQWKYLNDVSWTNLIAVASLVGATGSTGAAGTAIEVQNSGTYIQWRYVGAGSWTNLVALSAITGPTGNAGADGVSFIWRGAWVTSHSYLVNDVVSQNGNSYICLTAHTSGTFATDLAASKWQLMAQKGTDGIGSGDMLAATYDPTSKIADAFSQDNMADGTTNKNYSATDKTKLAGITAGADPTGNTIHGATGKTTPVDADETALIDSAASNVLKKLTWANLKATLKTYFDTLYSTAVKATGAEIDTGTDDAKFTTAKAIADSAIPNTLQKAGNQINSATSKATPVDADYLPLMDSAASNVLKKLSWANLKATGKTYFDTLYQPLDSDLTAIAGLTATTDNFIVSVASAWASRTPAQVKTTLALNNVDNTSNATERAATATLTNKTLTSPVINTPTGIVKGDVGLGNVDNTSDATKNSATATLTNKRKTRRASTVTQSATPTINTDNMDIAKITALAQAITSFTTNLTGTPVDGDFLEIQITDNATARAITWGASFQNGGIVNLPTTTVISTKLRVLLQWDATASKWTCVATA